MFIHQEEFDHFPLHTLKDDQGTLLEIVPSRGAIISRFESKSQPIFYLDRETLNDATKNVRGGNPVLFPICGPLVNGSGTFAGNSYEMKQHGFARNLPWQVVGVEAQADVASIQLRLESNETTKAQYPHDFCVELTYRLTADTLTIDQQFENRSSQVMPFYAGFHPYFTAPDKTAVTLSLDTSNYDDFLTKTTHSIDPTINFEAGAEINGAFHGVREPVRFSNFGMPYAIEIGFEAPYQHIVIWALKDKPFICVEPWMGVNYGLNNDISVISLAANSSLKAAVTYKVVSDR